MAKSKERNKTQELRRKGESIKDIARKLKIAKSTVSLWCRDIKLTPEQIERLHKKMLRGSYKGRLKGARIQYEQRLKRTKEFKRQGRQLIGVVSARDFMVSGAGIYWGEGSKKEQQGVRLINSDPKMIRFMLRWFKQVWGVSNNQINVSVMINKIHKKRVRDVEEHWSKITKIPLEQFHKTILIKAKNKKYYKNFSTHFGTLTIKIRKSTNLHRQITGMIEGLIPGSRQQNKNKPGSRLVSKVVS